VSTPESTGVTPPAEGLSSIQQHPNQPLCPEETRPGYARCHSRIRTDVTDATTPSGFKPADLVSAYNLPSSGGEGMTVAIVDAQDDPNAEADLGVYRSTFGLPACTTSNGCFKKVNQEGVQGSYPSGDTGWGGEISLDVQMVSAACPSCKIILVEVNSATTSDLGAGVNTAASLGANVISNRYGGAEDSTVASASSTYYNHPGILVTASNGDDGYGANFPASSQYVLAVGGTSLVKDSNTRGWTEGVWSGTGSGCSAYLPKPSWQTDKGCSKRTVGDVAAIADPNTGVAVYDTYGQKGWTILGGTSVASPLVAAIFALTGKAGASPSFAYTNPSDFYDVTSGSNGSCGGTYLCTGEVGYDGPTGNGTPNGNGVSKSDAGPPAEAGSGDSGGAAGSGGSSGSGGAAGSGGSSGSGGSAGSGGSSGSGGSKGASGSGGSGGSSGDGGYAFVEPRQLDRRHTIDLADGSSETVPFAWHESAGLESPTDLWVEAGGKQILQVSAVNGHPFARAGLDLVPLTSGTTYHVSFVRDGDNVTVSLLGEDDAAIIVTRADTAAGEIAVAAPAAAWGSSIVSEVF
jgi:hypothetical protein